MVMMNSSSYLKQLKIFQKNSVDLTLQLPDHLLHSIFSYLSFHDLLNISLVSKNWHRNIPSYLAFQFNTSLYHGQNPIYYNSDFRESLLSFLCGFKNDLFNAEKKEFCALCFSMKLLDENDVHEVYLRIEIVITVCLIFTSRNVLLFFI